MVTDRDARALSSECELAVTPSSPSTRQQYMYALRKGSILVHYYCTKAVRILRETLRLPANLPRLMLHAQAHVHHGEGEIGSMTSDDKSVRVVVVCGTSFFLRARPEGMLPPRPGVAAAAASPPADEEELRLGHGHAQGPGKGPERSSCSGVPSAAVHLRSPQSVATVIFSSILGSNFPNMDF